MKGNIRRVAIYSRKSKFTGKGESIGNQVELCQEFTMITSSYFTTLRAENRFPMLTFLNHWKPVQRAVVRI